MDENMPVKDLGLSTQTYHVLVRNGYKTVKSVLEATVQDLLMIRTLGPKCYNNIRAGLVEFGFLQEDAALYEDIPPANPPTRPWPDVKMRLMTKSLAAELRETAKINRLTNRPKTYKRRIPVDDSPSTGVGTIRVIMEN